MGLCLFFLTNFPGATFIQGATFIPESRVVVARFVISIAFTTLTYKGSMPLIRIGRWVDQLVN